MHDKIPVDRLRLCRMIPVVKVRRREQSSKAWEFPTNVGMGTGGLHNHNCNVGVKSCAVFNQSVFSLKRYVSKQSSGLNRF